MRSEWLYLRDIVDAADAIATYLLGVDRSEFLNDGEKQSAVAFQFTVIGESVRNLPDGLKGRYPHVKWTNARGLRNLIAHRYFGIDWTIIFDTATLAVPVLRQQVARCLETTGSSGRSLDAECRHPFRDVDAIVWNRLT